MPIATLRYTLPEEEAEFDAARTGMEARSVLGEIDRRLRSLLKYCDPSPELREAAEQLRDMIPGELLD